MKILVQETSETPQDWFEIDSSQWGSLTDPLQAVKVQGVTFDHGSGIALEELGDDVQVTEIEEGLLEGWKHTRVWIFSPLAADSQMGGAVNTGQSQTIYAQDDFLAAIPSLIQNTTLRAWSEFVSPPPTTIIARTLLTEAERNAHRAARGSGRAHGWRSWTDGLSVGEIDGDGLVKVQRDWGRYALPNGTITYFGRNTARANGIHVAPQENAFELTTAGAVSESINPTGVNFILFVFTTPANQPNVTDWPSGNYRHQLDVTAAGGCVAYGLLNFGGILGHFARVNSGLSSDLQTFQQTESAFSGTGLKLATTGTVDPSSGAASDRFECLLSGNDPCENEDAFTLELNESDDFADGPWVVAAVHLPPDLAHRPQHQPILAH